MDDVEFGLLLSIIGCASLAALMSLVPPETRERWYTPAGIVQTLMDPDKGEKETFKCLFGTDEHCYHVTRLRQPVLKALIEELDRRGDLNETGRARVSVAQQVVIYLDFVAHNRSIRALRAEYQHSHKTFQRIIKKVSKALCRMSEGYIKLPEPDFVHEKLQPSPVDGDDEGEKFKYFRGALGALDGTFIDATMPEEEQSVWRCRKNFLAQNVMAACDFDCRFQYVLAGYEGSATDSTVLAKAYDCGFVVPPGRYYLADGGYSHKDKRLLVPYQKTRYHLREQFAAARVPETKEELFNLRHAQLRNCIERIFGIMKKRFKIIRDGSNEGYSMLDQTRFVVACCVIHNFILNHGGQPLESEPDLLRSDGYIGNEETGGEEEPAPDANMERFRDRLAQRMWNDYQEVLTARGHDMRGRRARANE